MRDRAYLDFVRDRVLEHIKLNPSIRPYLGEEMPKGKTGPKPKPKQEKPKRQPVTAEAKRQRRNATKRRRYRERKQEQPR
jgi:hypothetical protein